MTRRTDRTERQRTALESRSVQSGQPNAMGVYDHLFTKRRRNRTDGAAWVLRSRFLEGREDPEGLSGFQDGVQRSQNLEIIGVL